MQYTRMIYLRWLVCLISLLISTAYAAPMQQTKLSSSTYTLSIKDLIVQDGFVLKGMGGGRDLYLPILPNWKVGGIHLHLLIARDKSSNNNVSVTALVKDFPISSINLSNVGDAPIAWDIDVPAKYLDGKVVTVALRRNWNEQGVTCTNYQDPGSWISIAGNSTIQYDYVTQPYQPNLSLFPAPFIVDPSIKKADALILLPQKFDTEDLESVYYVANTLTSRQTWRGIDISGSAIYQASDGEKAAHNVIIVGTADEIRGMIGLLDLPLKSDSSGMLVDSQNKRIDDNVGVVMIMTSPWNSQNALLIVTGNSHKGVKRAAQSLREPKFNKAVLFDKYALIDSIVRSSYAPIDWSNTTLADLGYKDMVVYGGGENSIKYDINLPANMIPQGIDMTVDYAASPLLSSRNSSFVSLKVNDFPITGIRVSAGDNQKEKWKFHVNGENLLPGKNQFNFGFNLKFYNTDCSPDDMSLAWGVIYASSKIQADLEKSDMGLTFGDFSVTKQNVSVFLPNDTKVLSMQELLELTLDMARNVFKIDNFQIYRDHDNLKNLAQDSNIIYIGSITDNSVLNDYRHHFPFCYLNNRLVVRPSLQSYLHVSDEIPVALIELISSPFDTDQQFLLITANDINGYKTAIDIFFNANKNQYLRGNAALVYGDGTFTSIDTNKLELKAKNNKLIKDTKRNVFPGLSVFLTIFFGGIILLIIYRRAKRYFSKTPKL
jgi:hypothetical protein